MNSIATALKTIAGFLVAKRDYVILTSLYLFHVITTYIWLKLDTLVLYSDAAKHYLTSLKIGDILGFHSILDVLNPLWLVKIPETEEVIRDIWAPFSQAIVTPFYTIFGREPDTAVLIQYAIFYLILIFSVYGIGRKLFSRNVGLLAAFITTMYPIVLNPYWSRCPERTFNMDMPLVAMVVLSLYVLLLTDSFRNRLHSILFGVTLSLGWLTKVSFPFFVIGPALLVIFLSLPIKRGGFIQNIRQHKGQILNMLLSLITLAPGIWYWALRTDVFSFYLSYPGIPLPPFFPIAFIEDMSSFLFIVSMLAFLYLIYLVIRKSLSWKSFIFLVLWIIIPFLILEFLRHGHREPRFIAPFLPAIALMTAVALERIKFIRLKACLVSLVVILCLVQFFSFSFGVPSLPAGTVEMQPWSQDFLFPDSGRAKQGWLKMPADENLEEVMKIVIYGERTGKKLEEFNAESRSVIKEWGDYLEICLICNGPYVTQPMRYYLYLYAPYIRPNGVEVDKADYVVTYESGVWDLSNYDQERDLRWQAYLEEHVDEYDLLGVAEVPDGDKLLVYRNKSTSRSPQSIAKLVESGLGRSWQPDTNMVAITSIHPDKLSYQAGERMTVTIGLKNIGDTPYDGELLWVLMNPGYIIMGEKGSEAMRSEKDIPFTLGVGEEVELSLGATVPTMPGSYELAAGLRVYTTEQHDKLSHGDVAFYYDKIEIKEKGWRWDIRW